MSSVSSVVTCSVWGLWTLVSYRYLNCVLVLFFLHRWGCWWARFERGNGVMETEVFIWSVELLITGSRKSTQMRALYLECKFLSHLECCDIRQYCTLMVSQRSFYLKCCYLFKNNNWIYNIKDKLSNKILVVIFGNVLKPDLGILKAMKVCYWISYYRQKCFLRTGNV